eukprot:263113_1
MTLYIKTNDKSKLQFIIDYTSLKDVITKTWSSWGLQENERHLWPIGYVILDDILFEFMDRNYPNSIFWFLAWKIIFLACKSRMSHFMEISEKNKLYKDGLKWQGTSGDEKIRSKYESTNDKEGQERRFDMDGSPIYGVISKKMHHYVIGCQD